MADYFFTKLTGIASSKEMNSVSFAIGTEDNHQVRINMSSELVAPLIANLAAAYGQIVDQNENSISPYSFDIRKVTSAITDGFPSLILELAPAFELVVKFAWEDLDGIQSEFDRLRPAGAGLPN